METFNIPDRLGGVLTKWEELMQITLEEQVHNMELAPGVGTDATSKLGPA